MFHGNVPHSWDSENAKYNLTAGIQKLQNRLLDVSVRHTYVSRSLSMSYVGAPF